MSKKPVVQEPLFGRLCLVTPASLDPATFGLDLDAALAAGDVASLIIAVETAAAGAIQRIAEQLVPIAQARGVAAIVVNEPRLCQASGADGVHIDTGLPDLKRALAAIRPAGIVGVGGIRSRHEAMLLAETECDYVFFGRFDGDTDAAIFDKTLDLAAWWSAIFQIPAIVMGGHSVECVTEAVDARIEFVALRSAVWDHPAGPAAAVAEANRLIAARQTEGAL